ncbi:uncharacterized protein N7482_006811 [Penicillium canariense]|uniref:Nucleotide-diphospho-sugar transferase domain-containing protein n=1 Tax=Penicillium canariense TaxID=189055 RepID=A0A9W9HYG6_9EURO|nr:uncharacterized protein N7482_006811 [Penicillium canariense]KAJ5159807.1 hypothetical protein N7482_006811 [Penicillium canariense]
MIHGYDYKLVTVSNLGERHGTWSKVPVIKEALRHHQFVVFMDADATFHYPQLPLEWLFNYWDITPDTLIAMAVDPNDPENLDARGRIFLNTGFIIAQQSPRTMELFEAWESCPENNVGFPDCSWWSFHWPHEQGAFGTHIRYLFNQPEDVKELPCAEANGCPDVANTGCIGEFVQHWWARKDRVGPAVGESIIQNFLPQLHSLFNQLSHSFVDNVDDPFGVGKGTPPAEPSE